MRLDNYLHLIFNLHLIPRYAIDYIRFKRGLEGWDCRLKNLLPLLLDRTSSMEFDGHYTYHLSWASRVLREMAPDVHIDISSSLLFCGIVSSFIPIQHYDYRVPRFELPDLECGTQDLLKLTFKDNSIKSLSCMHVIEHVGLGRYGDAINPSGDLLAAKELIRVLAPGGSLIIVTPLSDKAKIRFNAHRIYSLGKLKSLFEGLEMIEFSFLNDKNPMRFIRHAKEIDVVGSEYGCGCFIFQKSEHVT